MSTPSKATKQGRTGVSPISGTRPPVAHQFGQPNGNPRHNGAWKKEDTARGKLEALGKLTEQELLAIVKDKNAPMLERRIARALLNENDWKVTESMINQVYGMPKQEIKQTNIELKPILGKPKKGK